MKPKGKRRGAVLMVQGTASSTGKSLLVTGLCRLYSRRGLVVRPFKAQNMALNSFVTRAGHEIGRAQAVQAEAAGVLATVEMNPVLLKPEGNARSQVIVNGRSIGSMAAVEYYAVKRKLSGVIADALETLLASSDLVVIEGAGSPAEINLRERDIVNMHVAHLAKAPVLLVGDIDRGGVFAHFFGTLGLLDERDRARVVGLVINKFRGDMKILDPGLDMIEERTGVPVLGVVPFLPNLRIADEDSVSLDHRMGKARGGPGDIEIAVVRFPRISNYDDFLALEFEPGVVVRFVDHPDELEGADLVILPGTKDTRSDLEWMRCAGICEVILKRAERGEAVLGVCGGFQMLGAYVCDSEGVEGRAGQSAGLGLLPIHTEYSAEKCTRQVSVRIVGSALLGDSLFEEERLVSGYEIHQGSVVYAPGAQIWFRREEDGHTVSSTVQEGASTQDEGCWSGAVAGTLLHGIFEDRTFRQAMLAALGWRREAARQEIPRLTDEYDRLADALEESLDIERIDAHIFG